MDMEKYLAHNDLHDSYQSAYCSGDSTETAFLIMHRDIAEALDEGSMHDYIDNA